MTDKTPEELKDDVVAAAEALVARWGYSVTHPSIQEAKNICAAVKALRASRKPKGVKPEEVEPRTRFRFDPQNSCHGGKVTFTLLGGKKNATRFWLSEEGNFAFEFDANDRIIPIEEEAGQECEHEYVRDIKACYSIVCKKCGEPFP